MGVGVVDSNYHHQDDINRTSRELFWDVEQKLLMHKLAKEYYGFRAFWFQCLPLLLMSACMTILSFICYRYGLSIDGHEGDVEIIETKQWMTLSIGILGIISTVLTSIMINTKYQAQQSMHAAAERSLSKICQQVRFPDGSKSLVDHINTQKGIYLALSYSDIPTKISQPFRDLHHVMNNKPYMFRAIQYERCYYYLYKSFGKKRHLWPMCIREVNVVSMSTSNNLGRLIEEEYAKYTKGMKEIVQKKSSIRSLVTDEEDSSGSRRRIQRRRSSNVHSEKSDHSNSSDDEYEMFQQSLLRRSSSTASSTTAAQTQDPPV